LHLINGIKQPWWSHFDSMHGIQSPFYFIFCFIYHKLYILCDFCNYDNIMWDLYAQKARGSNVKVHYEFGNDWKKMCFDTKQEWKLTIELKTLELCRIVFLSCILWFLINHFLSWVFYIWACTFFLPSMWFTFI
jgi:hypothetical protein